ncbi:MULTISPECIES: outer membrane protein assembly factor BamB family protein [Nocardiopsis]|uniref:outer membrane protein assembly factor BamB family protein n=1 Tax=Nocardiopsis TaxID=2013 RepID=UPI0014796AA3|nr:MULTISPECIES: PQQ-binding-like beta-propeller repeat protein [Nocardiopsis]
MRSPLLRSAAAAATILTASACTVAPSPREPAPDTTVVHLQEAGYEPTASDISPREHLLCTPGGERAPDCADQGQVRWSLPLEGEYRLTGNLALHHLDTGALLRDAYSYSAFKAVDAGEGGVFYAENSLLRMVDADTGELLWTTDLRENPGLDFLHSGLWSLHADDDRIVLRFEDGFVQVDAEDGSVSSVAPRAECSADLMAIHGNEVVLERCGGDEGSYLALDLSTGRVLREFREADPEEVAGDLLRTGSSWVRVSDVEGGPATAVETDDYLGPAGLGTIGLNRIGDIAVALACAPDGLGPLRSEPHAPGVACLEPRLYAVTTG